MSETDMTRFPADPEPLSEAGISESGGALSDEEVVALQAQSDVLQALLEDGRWSEQEMADRLRLERRRLVELTTMMRAEWDGLSTPVYFTENGNLIRRWTGRWLLLRTCDVSGMADDGEIWIANNSDIADWRLQPIEYWQHRQDGRGYIARNDGNDIDWRKSGF